MTKKMSWKYIFNSSVGNKWWGSIDAANNAAKDAGYKFFSWNGWVYEVDGSRTTILVNDCF